MIFFEAGSKLTLISFFASSIGGGIYFLKDNIFFVGNTMIDTLISQIKKLKKPNFYNELKLKEKQYIVLTVHRPSNVDEINILNNIISFIDSNCNNHPIIFPIHPRTLKNYKQLSIKTKNIYIVDPLSYHEFNYLVKNSKCVITDSGGITEEATFMNIPCITLRDNTERPETVEIGTNLLVGNDVDKLKIALLDLFDNKWKKGKIPYLWDGNTSKRIVEILLRL